MTQGERLSALRHELNLSMEAFGKKIGVGKTTIFHIEKGETSPRETNIKLICSLTWPGGLRVSEVWLRDGTGEMFLPPSSSEQIAAYVGDVLRQDRDTLERRILAAMSRLSPDEWRKVEAMIDRMADLSTKKPGG